MKTKNSKSEKNVVKSTLKNAKSIVKKVRIKLTEKQIEKILTLRESGLSYEKIEKHFGWEGKHGVIAWRCCLNYELK